jgi:DNA gyrase/topoisomerase IV subunit A
VSVHFVLNFSSSAVVDNFMKIESNGFTKFENEFKLVSLKLLGTTNMYLFNQHGQITKYETPMDIVREFYDIRLQYYQKRKDSLLQQLVHDNALIENKVRFIRAVVAEQVHVHKLRKQELECYLKENDYIMHNDSYDYILKIPVYNLTIDKVEDLEKEYSKKCAELDVLINTDIKDMWCSELDAIDIQNYIDVAVKPAKVLGGRKKKVT